MRMRSLTKGRRIWVVHGGIVCNGPPRWINHVSGHFNIKGKYHRAFKRTLRKSGRIFMWSETTTKTGIASNSIINTKTGLPQQYFVVAEEKIKIGEFVAGSKLGQTQSESYRNYAGEFDQSFNGWFPTFSEGNCNTFKRFCLGNEIYCTESRSLGVCKNSSELTSFDD